MDATPQVTSADVERLVERDFPPEERELVGSILAGYGSEDGHADVDRIRAAALKLSGGDADSLRLQIEVAGEDWSDVVAAAETPGYAEKVRPGAEMNDAELRRITEADSAQYREWLDRE